MDVSSDGHLRLFRPGHWPLLWLVLPLVLGYSLGATTGFELPVEATVILAMLLLGGALAFKRGDSQKHFSIWAGCFLLGVILLAWS